MAEFYPQIVNKYQGIKSFVSFYKWRKALKENQGRLEVLNDKPKTPKKKREPNWDPKIVEYIKELRQQYPRLGKDKIKPFLDEFCSQNCLKTIYPY